MKVPNPFQQRKATDVRVCSLFLSLTHPSLSNSPFAGCSRYTPPWVGEEVGVRRHEDSPSVPLDSTPARAKDKQ